MRLLVLFTVLLACGGPANAVGPFEGRWLHTGRACQFGLYSDGATCMRETGFQYEEELVIVQRATKLCGRWESRSDSRNFSGYVYGTVENGQARLQVSEETSHSGVPT